MTKRTVTFFMLLAVCMLVHAQTYRIEGTVIDKTSRKPLEFVNVLVVGLGIGSSTDAEGHFAVEQVLPEFTVCKPLCWGIKRSLLPNTVSITALRTYR